MFLTWKIVHKRNNGEFWIYKTLSTSIECQEKLLIFKQKNLTHLGGLKLGMIIKNSTGHFRFFLNISNLLFINFNCFIVCPNVTIETMLSSVINFFYLVVVVGLLLFGVFICHYCCKI